VSSPGFFYANTLRLTEPLLELFAETTPPTEVMASWLSDPGPDGGQRLGLAYGGQGSPAELGQVQGKLVVLEVPDTTGPDDLAQRVSNVKDAGGVAVAINQVSSNT